LSKLDYYSKLGFLLFFRIYAMPQMKRQCSNTLQSHFYTVSKKPFCLCRYR